jgi:hypothetical protein
MLPPPHIRIEDYYVSISPKASMFLNFICPYDPVLHPVDDRVVAVGLQQQWRPVEVYGCIVFLKS